MHITILACGVWNLESTHTNAIPTHWPGFISVCCNQQPHVSTRKSENWAGITHIHIVLSLTRILLCNIILVFWAQYYNFHSKILFKRFFEAFHWQATSTMKPPLQHLETQTSDSWSSDILKLFQKSSYFFTWLNKMSLTQTVLQWTVLRIFNSEWLASSAHCNYWHYTWNTHGWNPLLHSI